MKSTFKKIPTKAQYQAMVKAMPTRELEGLAETFNLSTSVNTVEALIRDVLNAEMESRILAWEAQ